MVHLFSFKAKLVTSPSSPPSVMDGQIDAAMTNLSKWHNYRFEIFHRQNTGDGKKRGWKTNKLTTIITALTTIIGSDEVEREEEQKNGGSGWAAQSQDLI